MKFVCMWSPLLQDCPIIHPLTNFLQVFATILRSTVPISSSSLLCKVYGLILLCLNFEVNWNLWLTITIARIVGSFVIIIAQQLACLLSFFSIHSILLPGILPIFPHSSVAAISKLSTSTADRTKNYHTQHTIIYFRHSVLCPLIVEKSGFFSKIYYHQFLLTYRLITNIWALRFPIHLLVLSAAHSPFKFSKTIHHLIYFVSIKVD